MLQSEAHHPQFQSQELIGVVRRRRCGKEPCIYMSGGHSTQDGHMEQNLRVKELSLQCGDVLEMLPGEKHIRMITENMGLLLSVLRITGDTTDIPGYMTSSWESIANSILGGRDPLGVSRGTT